MKKTITFAIVGIVVGLGVGFFAGMQYGKTAGMPLGFPGNRTGTDMNRFAGLSGGRNTPNAEMLSGEILNLDANSATIKMRNGGSKIILFSTSTEFGKFVTGNVSDLEVGKTITVSGKTNPDGSLTAQSIQLRSLIPIERP